MRQTLTTLLFSLFLLSGYAQPIVDFEKLEEKYGKHNAVIRNLQYEYLFDVVNDSLSVRQTNTLEMLILKEHAKMFTNENIYYGGFSSISNKEAYSLVPDGNKYKKIKVQKFNESHDRNGNVFYDDSKIIKFSYPSVQKKAQTFLSYDINYHDPHFIRMSFLQSYIPVIYGKVTAKVHADVKIAYKVFNDSLGRIKFNQYKKGKYYYYEWEISDMEEYKYAIGKNYSISHYSPHVALFIDETNINKQKQNYFGNTDDLYHFYTGFIRQVKSNDSSELKELVSKLTSGLSDHDKVKAIFYWVQQNIKYLAYEQGYLGIVPSAGTEVFSKRFGDCKGMSSIIKEMTRLAGVDVHYAWVGTRDIPYTYNALPTPAVDNHMIAAFLNEDSVVLLDATNKFLDYGINPSHLQDKEVLIGLDANNHKIFKVPKIPATYSTVIDSVTMRLEENSVIGSGTRIHTGFNKEELAYALDHIKIEDYPKTLSKLFNKGNNKFIIDSYQASGLFEHDTIAKVNYGFTLHDYGRSLNDDIYVNMDLDKKYKEMKIDTSTLYAPIENDFHCTEKFIYTLKIPQGYELDYMPKGGAFDCNEFGYKISYTYDKNTVIMKKELRFEFLILLEDKFEQWNKMIKQLNKHYRSTVVLKKKTKLPESLKHP